MVNGITYLDTEGAEQTLASDQYVQPRPGIARGFSRLVPALAGTWPELAPLPGAFRVEFNAGFGATAAEVPEDIAAMIYILAAWWYEQRLHVNVGNIVNALPDHYTGMIEAHRISHIA